MQHKVVTALIHHTECCGATANWGNPWTGCWRYSPSREGSPNVSLLCFHQEFNWLHTGAPGSCFLPAQQEGRTFLSQLSQAHPDASTGRGWDGFFEWTVLIYSVNLQYRAVTVHFSVSLMFFLSIQFWLLLPGKCCAGWVLLTWERSHCYNGSIKIAAISRICPDYT